MKRRIRRATAGMLVSAALVAGGWSCTSSGQAPWSGLVAHRVTMHDAIREQASRGDSAWVFADTVDADRTWGLVRAFYADRHDRPAWSDGRTLGPAVDELMGRIYAAELTGLDRDDYEIQRLARMVKAIRRVSKPGGETHLRALARLDVHATWAYLRLAEHLAHGRVPLASLDPDWVAADTASARWTRNLEDALRDQAVGAALDSLEPRDEGYRRLKEAYSSYRMLGYMGGWPGVPAGPPLKLGDRGRRVGTLIRRLAATGELRGRFRGDSVVDRRVERAIGDFQTRHGIPRSGIAGDLTIQAMNVTLEERLRAMRLDLERWRWLPDTLGARYIAVNIPAYRLDLVRDDKVEKSLRVVVGNRKSPTPVFSDQITYMDLNPTWTVPKTILVKEVVPSFRRNKHFFAQNRMRVIPWDRPRRDTSVSPGDVPWQDVEKDSFPYLVVQDAGPDNPLGRIKLMCPNEYDVYLHDTPQRERFAQAARDLSHGCVRVAGAWELADSLIGWSPGDPSRMFILLADTTSRRMRLARPTPVHFLYWTAWVDEDGTVEFREDLYGLDRRLDRALRDRSVYAFQVNPDVAMSPLWLAQQAEAAEKARLKALAAAAPKGRGGTANASMTGTGVRVNAR